MGNDSLDFCNRNCRQEAQEQAEHRHEQSKASDECRNIPPGRGEVTPAGGQEVAVQGGHNDYETLKPHTDVDEDGCNEQEWDVRAKLLRPEELRRNNVAANHRPVSPGVGTEESVDEGKAFVGVTTVPRHEELDAVRVTDESTGQQHDLRHVFEVANGNQVLQTEHNPRHNHQRHNHRESGEDRARNKVRREDGRVPTGQLGGCEVEGYNGVNRKNQRSRESSEKQVRALVVQPVTSRSAPSKSKEAVDEATEFGLLTVTEGGQVRDKTGVPEQNRNGTINTYREDVPNKRTTEVGPHVHLVGQGQHPVRQPGATNVNTGKDQRTHNGEDGHRLCRTVNGRTPFLSEEEENRGNQSTRVTDTNPEYEVDNRPTPSNRIVNPPNTRSLPEEVTDGETKHTEKHDGDSKNNIPANRRRPFGGCSDGLGDTVERGITNNQRSATIHRIEIAHLGIKMLRTRYHDLTN